MADCLRLSPRKRSLSPFLTLRSSMTRWYAVDALLRDGDTKRAIAVVGQRLMVEAAGFHEREMAVLRQASGRLRGRRLGEGAWRGRRRCTQ